MCIRDREKIDAQILEKMHITLLDSVDEAIALVLPERREMMVAV